MYGLFPFTLRQQWYNTQCIIDAAVDERLFILTCPVQYKIRHLVLVTGMANAYPQAMKLLADLCRNISQAIMTTVATAGLEAYIAGRQVDFIMGNENIGWRDFVETGQLVHR